MKNFIKKHKKILRSAAINLSIAVLLPAIIFFSFSWYNDPLRVAARERNAFINSLTREDFIYDVNYMLRVLEENFPSFEIIYSRNGVDMHEKGRNIREYIENPSNRMNFYRFWDVLHYDYFVHAFPVGHLRTVSTSERHWLLASTLEWVEASPNDPFTVHFVNALDSPATRLAYPPLSPETMAAVEATFAPEGNLTKEIIQEGQIAYLAVGSMLPSISDAERAAIRDFYAEIADFEHLIIDIRGNGGGWVHYFDELIARPLTTRETRIARFYHFMPYGDHNMDFMRAAEQTLLTRLRDTEFLEQYLHYTAEFERRFVQRHHVRGQWRSDFNGKIWMLIDGGVFSSSQIVAEFYKQTGFATFVGETTGGMVAAPMGSNFFALPNTGIIIRYDPTFVTNRYGRPLEYGTRPHHYNRPGMDALETTLALIAEGGW
ncbi:MAG: hypothetical protein LBE55_02865 [Clostridiales bacterium]|jgi:hypothetical protein|nr:hypothetical protein [Clostridiales bacterium]